MTDSFEDSVLNSDLKEVAKCAGFTTQTPIQKEAIPVLLDGKDVLARAQTGTGKTAAFLFPMIQKLCEVGKIKSRTPQALILCPTRELVIQLEEQFDEYTKDMNINALAVFGGVPRLYQLNKNKSQITHLLIATPGRLKEFVEEEILTLDEVKIFVLDEADRLLDLGFKDVILGLISKLPTIRQSSFFTATIPKKIERLAQYILTDHKKIDVIESLNLTAADNIVQRVYYLDDINKKPLLKDLLDEYSKGKILIFTRTQDDTDDIVRYLKKKKIRSSSLHGGKTQENRLQTIKDFETGKIRILIATDIAARGLNITDIEVIINYSLPDNQDIYVHRIGRTARAGGKGIAISLCAGDEKRLLKKIERKMRNSIRVDRNHKYHSNLALSGKNIPNKALKTSRKNKNKSSKVDISFAVNKRK